jgi:predicted nucleic acid-binding protein
MIYYFDTSALVKLVVEEDGSDTVYELWRRPDSVRVSSALAKSELLRAVRTQDARVKQRARELLAMTDLIPVDDGILETAAVLDPSVLRTLDAIHLASALAIGTELAGVVVYDVRLAQAAANQGLRRIGVTP